MDVRATTGPTPPDGRFLPVPPPPWWTLAHWREAELAARRAFPRETCGLWFACPADGPARLHVFPASASPVWVLADPREVVAFAYRLRDCGGRVLATFHTHPSGFLRPSRQDESLADWADHHLIAGCQAGIWAAAWWRTVRG